MALKQRVAQLEKARGIGRGDGFRQLQIVFFNPVGDERKPGAYEIWNGRALVIIAKQKAVTIEYSRPSEPTLSAAAAGLLLEHNVRPGTKCVFGVNPDLL